MKRVYASISFCIGTSDINEWTITDPKGHISWSSEVNSDNDMKYKPLVKMLKWWRRIHCPDSAKFPKGLTLEKIIADNLPVSDLNTENHLIGTMQNIVTAYKEDYIDKSTLPIIQDPCIDENDLLSAYSFSDFETFISKISEHLQLIAEAEPTNETWRTVLGTEFPKDDDTNASVTKAMVVATQSYLFVPHRQKPLWSLPRGAAVIINAQVGTAGGVMINLENNGAPIPKHRDLLFRALHSVKQPYYLKWQVVNTGNDAAQAACLRGGFENSSDGFINCRKEATQYTGKHYIQCFVIKDGRCVAKSKEFVISIE